MAVGAPLGLKPGHTSSIRRIEGAMLSYHADATIDTNPFELDLDRLVAVDSAVDFIGKDALRRIRDEGVTESRPASSSRWSRSPARTRRSGRSQPAANVPARSRRPSGRPASQNIALAMVRADAADVGTALPGETNLGPKAATGVEKPFHDPKKSLATG